MSTTTAIAPELSPSKERYFAANRSIWLFPLIFSITASWVQAPALVTSAEAAFRWGWQGLLWFAIPNMLALVIFAPFAHRIRSRLPHGFTLSGYMRQAYGPKVQRVYLFQMTALSICVFAVPMIAGGTIIAYITGWDYWLIAALMAGGTLLYSTLGGLTASVIADFFHIGATIMTIALFAPILVKTVGLDTLAAGMSSAHVDPWTVALTFGIPTAIGLMSGPFGDQSFWQRSFATNARHLRKAFTIAGFLFVLVPLSTGMLGFVAAGTGMEIENTQLANIAVINEYFPAWAMIPFTIMVIGALASTMDNCLVSGSTMMGHDLTDKGDPIRRGRIGGFAVAIIGLSIALIPGLTLIHLWLIYATMRAATLAPTILTFIRKDWMPAANGMFWGIIIALAVAMPLFIYGSFVPGADMWKTIASLLTIIISTTFCLLVRKSPQEVAARDRVEAEN